MLFCLAPLTEEQLATIQELEQVTGKTILALRRMEVLPADLSDDDLGRLQMLEVDLGMSLVAVDK